MHLHDWQQQLQQVVLKDRDNPALLLQPGSIERRRQLAVYSNAYQARLTEALRTNYGMLHQLLGDDDFDIMARQYTRAHPPASTSIRWFGDQLAVFLGETPPFNEIPAIAELAEFEWALRGTIDAADAEILTAEELQIIPLQQWGRLKFNLHPSLRILELNWNTPQIWRALNDDLEPPKPRELHQSWLIYRQPNLETHWRSADYREVRALQTWVEGGSFDDICVGLFRDAREDETCDDIAMLAATQLKTWVQQGLLAHP